MSTMPHTVMQELSNTNCLEGRILVYGGDSTAMKYWCSDFFDPLHSPKMPLGKYDTIVCMYVLCVLTPAQRAFVLNDILKHLRKGGQVYFAVTPGYCLPFKLFFSSQTFAIYRSSHQSLTNWSKIYETREIARMMQTYVNRRDVLWKEWTRSNDPVTAQLADDFQVVMWHEGGHRPDEEMITKLRFAHGASMSYNMEASGQLWRSVYHQSIPYNEDDEKFPFPVWYVNIPILTFTKCRKLLDTVLKESSYTKELDWAGNF